MDCLVEDFEDVKTEIDEVNATIKKLADRVAVLEVAQKRQWEAKGAFIDLSARIKHMEEKLKRAGI